MKRAFLKSILLLGILGGFVSGCMNPGIEVGNPDLDGKSVTVKAQGSEISYNIDFMQNPNASVSQILGNLIDTVSVVYDYNFPQVQLQTTFSDKTEIEVLLTVSKSGEFIDAVLKINDQTLPAGIESQTDDSSGEEPLSCVSGSANAGLQITEALCSQIVACLPQVACTDCRSAVLQLPDLGFDFGGNSGQTLSDLEQAIDNGQWEADPTTLHQCLNDIPLVPCPTVVGSVSAGPPAEYGNLRQMIPKPSCARGVLKPKNDPLSGSGNGNVNGNGNESANGLGKALAKRQQ